MGNSITVTETTVCEPEHISEKILYLSGPMSGIANYNYSFFNSVAESLRGQGYDVLNPAEGVSNPRDDWEKLMRRDLLLLLQEAVGIVVLPGWQNSHGANLEVLNAIKLKIPIYEWPSLNRLTLKGDITIECVE